jgi:hypothetical protein
MFKAETESRSAFVSTGPSGSVTDGQDRGSAAARSQAETPLIVLSRFPAPALSAVRLFVLKRYQMQIAARTPGP